MIISTKELEARTEILEKSIDGNKFTISIFDGSILESTQKEPYKYLTSTDVPIINLFAEGKIVKRDDGVIDYPEFISDMDKEYIECNFEDYVEESKNVNIKEIAQINTPVKTTDVGEIPPSLPLAAAVATMAPMVNPTLPAQPVPHTPVQIPTRPANDNPMRAGGGFDRMLDGSTRLNYSQIVQVEGDVNVDLSKMVEVVPSQSPTFVDIPTPSQIATEQPKTVEVQPPKIQKSKGDLKEAAPQPTIVPNNEVDASKQLLEAYPVLENVKKIICGDSNTFDIKLAQDHGLITVTVVDKDDPTKIINDLSIIVDPLGQIHTKGQAKFWPISDSPVDFTVPYTMNDETVKAYINGITTNDMLSYSERDAKLNKVVELRSVTDKVNGEALDELLDRLVSIFEKKEITSKCANRRFKMVDYKDIDNFKLVSDNSVLDYVTAGKNKGRKPISITVENGTGQIVNEK